PPPPPPPRVVSGPSPRNGDGNDVVVWDSDGNERVRFTFPRQRRDRRLCIADFFPPTPSGEPDVIGMHVVTMGLAASEATARLFADNRYREYLELHGVTVEMAEALAEYWHQRVREELGPAGHAPADMEDLFDQGSRGSRYSFGYPACPDLEEQTKLFELLKPERIGGELSEEFQLHPEQSTSAIIVHHPEAKYFNARCPVAASSEQLFVSRLARLPVRAPTGETIGRIADVVIARRESGAPPPVLGFTVMVQRRPIFLGVGRVRELDESGAVLTTGTVNLRPFQQREGETLVIGELLDARV